MIIDVHCHATNPPASVSKYRQDALDDRHATPPLISDDELLQSIEGHIDLMNDRGVDLGLLSPRASTMGHGDGDFRFSSAWGGFNNDLIARIVDMSKGRFRGVCQLPESTDSTPTQWLAELSRRVDEGFVGVNVNPDISGGVDPRTPSLRDAWWDPLWEALTELDVPVMLHASGSKNPSVHMNATHYLGTDFSSVVELCRSDVFSRFPGLKIIVPHGGGATWFFYERLRALSVLESWPFFEETLHSLFFDTAVYDEEAVELVIRRATSRKVLFSSEIFGTAKAIDPTTGRTFDDVIPQLSGSNTLSAQDKELIFSTNAIALFGLGKNTTVRNEEMRS